MPNSEAAYTAQKASKPAPAKGHLERSRPTRTLPTDRISFDNQLNVLRGYAAASGASLKPVTNEEVAKIISTITRKTVSLANSFFVDNGFLQRTDQAIIPSESVVAFARAWEWGTTNAGHKLAPVISRTWFAEKLIPMLRFRTLTEDEAISELGGHINAGKDYRPQLRTLLDYLEVANLVKRENGTLRRVDGAGTGPATENQPAPRDAGSQEPPRETSLKPPVVATSYAQATQGIINFHVDVRVDMAEFSDWSADRITAFFSGVAQVLAAKSALEKGVSGE